MSETIGFIGSGLVGSHLAKLAVDSGYKAALSNSKAPGTLTNIIKALGPKAIAATSLQIANDESIKIVVLSVPLKVIPKLSESVGGLKNKIVIDTSNYYTFREGNIKELDDRKLTTTEYVASFLDTSAKVVKMFNNFPATHLLMAASKTNPTRLPISGDKETKEIVSEFVKNLGFVTVDAGELQDSWKFEPNSPLYGSPFVPVVPKDLNETEDVEFFMTHVAPPLTEEKALKILSETKLDFPAGGTVDLSSVMVRAVTSFKPFGL